jgi:hypothetical protein
MVRGLSINSAWINTRDGRRLSGYLPQPELIAILENHVNKERG